MTQHFFISDEYLRGENQLDDHVVHLLFSSNRWEKSAQLIQTLVRGPFINHFTNILTFSETAIYNSKLIVYSGLHSVTKNCDVINEHFF